MYYSPFISTIWDSLMVPSPTVTAIFFRYITLDIFSLFMFYLFLINTFELLSSLYICYIYLVIFVILSFRYIV